MHFVIIQFLQQKNIKMQKEKNLRKFSLKMTSTRFEKNLDTIKTAKQLLSLKFFSSNWKIISVIIPFQTYELQHVHPQQKGDRLAYTDLHYYKRL